VILVITVSIFTCAAYIRAQALSGMLWPQLGKPHLSVRQWHFAGVSFPCSRGYSKPENFLWVAGPMVQVVCSFPSVSPQDSVCLPSITGVPRWRELSTGHNFGRDTHRALEEDCSNRVGHIDPLCHCGAHDSQIALLLYGNR